MLFGSTIGRNPFHAASTAAVLLSVMLLGGCSKGATAVGAAATDSGSGTTTTTPLQATVTSITPPIGFTGGSTLVTIVGTNFQSGATVTVGGQTCTNVTVVSATQITCDTSSVPAGGGDVIVTNPGAAASTALTGHFVFQAAPTISTITPTGGSLLGGTVITIVGDAISSTATVAIGPLATCGPPVNVSADGTTATCTVICNGGCSGSNDTVTISNGVTGGSTSGGGGTTFTFQPGPSTTSVSPTAGAMAGGTTLTINGSNFIATPTVKVGGNTCTSPNFVNAGQITCTLPSSASSGAKTVVVTNPDGQTDSNRTYTYNAAPTVSSISPTNGPATISAGTLTINGSNFVATPTVTVGGTTCTSPSFVSSSQITCTMPTHSAGSGTVIVTNPDSQTNNSQSFTFDPAPAVTTITPSSGSPMGGATLTFTGTNFTASPTNVKIGGVACASSAFVNSTTITCVTPTATAASGKVGLVTSADGQSGSGGTYTYNSFLYVAQGGSTTWQGASVNPGTGALTGFTGTATNAPVAIANHPTLKMAYMASATTAVNSYSIDATSGALASLGSAGTLASGYTAASSIAVLPNGKFAYVTNNTATASKAKVTPLALDATTGTITSVGTPVAATVSAVGQLNPQGIAFGTDSGHAYVGFNGSDVVCTFSINSGTGALTQQGTTCISAPGHVSSVLVESSGKYLYAVGNGSAAVFGYSFDGSGNPVANLTGGSQYALANAAPGAISLAATTNGFLYVVNNDNTIGYYTIDTTHTVGSGGGSLSAATLVTPSGSPSIGGIATDPTNQYFYLTDNNNNVMRIYTIGSGGALTEIGGSPFDNGATLNNPLGISFTPL